MVRKGVLTPRTATPAVHPALHRLVTAVVPPVLAFLLYGTGLTNPFVYDDFDTVVANPSLAEPLNLTFILVHSPFRPVVNVSYALDRAFWGIAPWGFHLTNALLHSAVALLLYFLARRALRDVDPSRGEIASRGDVVGHSWAASVAATLFAAHPLMSEAAGYVSGRSELLCGLFFIATVLCGRAVFAWQNAGGAAAVPDRRRLRPAAAMLGAVVFGLLALLSKEVAVALPVVLLAYDWLVLPGPAEVRTRRLLRLFLPLGVVAMAAVGYRLSALDLGSATDLRAPHLNLLTQAIVIWRYIGLLLLPVGQAIMHGVRYVTTVADPSALAAAAGLLGLAGIAFRLRQRAPLLAFGYLWFLATLAPSSSVVSLREGMAEHRVYLAGAGLVMAAVSVVSAWPRVRRSRGAAISALGLAAVVTVALSSLTVARLRVWASPVMLWREAAARAPGMWEPHYALGDALREAGDCAAAVPAYAEAVRLRPGHRDAYTNMGICLARIGRLHEAEDAFLRVVDIDPAFPRGYSNLAALAITTKDYERARSLYLKTLEVDARNVLARMQLARLYEEVFKDYHAAARMCGEARAIQPFTPGVVECVERNRRLAAQRDAGR